jgi:uncharacterized delta-60 repeat protein
MTFGQRITLAAILLMTSLSAAAAAGIVVLDFGINTQDDVVFLRTGPEGQIYVKVATYGGNGSGLFALDANGTLINSFASGGRMSLDGIGLANMLIRSGGSFFSIEQAGIRSRDAEGFVLWTSPNPFTRGFGYNLARQPDGRLVIAGETNTRLGCSAGCLPDLAGVITRFNADGSSDLSFGNGAVVVIGGAPASFTSQSLNVLPDGKILLSGYTNAFTHTFIVRLNADGTTDASFGTNGNVPLVEGYGVTAIDSVGRIYVPGAKGTIVRLTSDGTLDATYIGGTEQTGLATTGIAIDSQDRAVLFGTDGSGSVKQGYLARFDTSGNYDPGFAGTGEVRVLFATPVRTATNGFGPLCVGGLQAVDTPLISCTVEGEGDPIGQPKTNIAIARLSVAGVLDTNFGAGQPDPDNYPDPFSFPDVTVPYGAANVESAAVTVSGFIGPTTISLGGTVGQFSVGCTGTFTYNTATTQTITPGQTVCLRQSASIQPGGTTQSTLVVGGRVATFTVHSTNSPADSVPDSFTFTDQSGVALGTAITSNTVSIQGITGFATVTVENGSYSIGCDPQQFTTTSTTSITNGMTICVRQTSSAVPGTETSTKLTVSGVSDTFTTTTVPADLTPDAFAFTDQTNVTVGTTVVSNAVTVAGINAAANISVSGGEFSIGCNGTFTAAAGTIQAGQTVCVRHVAATAASTATNTTLMIGDGSDTFMSTTAASTGGVGGSSGGGGALDRLTLVLFMMFVMIGCGIRLRRASRQIAAVP